MADPHIVEKLDGFDRITVRLYRYALFGSVLALLITPLQSLDPLPDLLLITMVWVATQMIHIYDHKFRFTFRVLGSVGAVLAAWALLFGPASILRPLMQLAGFGFACAALSAIALKERFCFKIPGLRAVPLFLGAGVLWRLYLVVAPVADDPLFEIPFVLAGVIVLMMAVAKARMPLTHDIGDRSAYTN